MLIFSGLLVLLASSGEVKTDGNESGTNIVFIIADDLVSYFVFNCLLQSLYFFCYFCKIDLLRLLNVRF